MVLNAQHTTEDNLALVKLASSLGAERLYLAALGGWEGDDILRSDDNNPNRAGATQAAGEVGLRTLSDLIGDVQSGEVQGIVALGWASAERLEELAPLLALDAVVSLSSHIGALPAAAEVVIPVAEIFEVDGSFINAKGMAQEFRRVLSAPADIEPGWKVVADIAKALGQDLGFTDLQSLRKGLSDAAEAAQ